MTGRSSKKTPRGKGSAKISPEDLELRKVRNRELKRLQRASMLPEKYEAEKVKRREYARRKRQELRQDPIRYSEHLQKETFRRLVKRTNMTPEEKEQERQKDYFHKQAWLAKKGREELEELRQKKYQQHKKWLANLTPEGKQRHNETLYRCQKRHLARKCGIEVEEALNMTLGQLQVKYWDRMKRDNPQTWERHQEKMRERLRNYQRKLYQNETPEQRKKRNWKLKVNAEKRKLRKRLQGEGVMEEEVEERLREVHERMWKEFDPQWSWDNYRRGWGGKKKYESKEPKVPLEMTTPKSEAVIIRIPPPKFPSPDISPDDQYSPPPSPPASPTSPSPPPPPAIVDTSLPCPHCTSHFPSDLSLRQHIRASHFLRAWLCPRCTAVVLSPQELTAHFQNAHKPKFNFWCMRCSSPGGFHKREQLFQHVKETHRDNYWPCETCQVLKYSQESLRHHKRFCTTKVAK